MAVRMEASTPISTAFFGETDGIHDGDFVRAAMADERPDR
jgi:hypothetical protein